MYFLEKFYIKVLFLLVLIIFKIIYFKEFILNWNGKKIELNGFFVKVVNINVNLKYFIMCLIYLLLFYRLNINF